MTLVPCDARGTVASGAVPVEATARVDDSAPTAQRLTAALTRKYGVKYRMLAAGSRLRRGSGSVALVVTR